LLLKKFIGETIADLANKTSIFWKEVRVFLLENKNDTTGTLVAKGFSLKEVLGGRPALAQTVVLCADNFYGETILRVILPKEEPENE